MRLSRFSVHRPVFISMLTLIVIILGGISLVRLPIDLMPDITDPTISVSTLYENASPAEVEELITRPIEEAMSAVPGVKEVSSSSQEGDSSVRVTFAWGTDLDAAANDIRDRLDRVVPMLPEDAERPMLRKFDLASFPILILGASSRLDPVQMRRLIDDQIKYRIERVPGVAALMIWGGLEREIHVNLLPERLKALHLPLDLILTKLRAENVNVPAGTIDRGNYEIMIRTPGEYRTLDDIRQTVVAVRDGVAIRLSDIARVDDAWQRITRLVRVNGEPGIRLSVNKQSGTNTVEVARGVMEEIERINQDLPQIRIIPIIDSAAFIQRSIHNVSRSALFGGTLAIFVLLLFLRNIRSTMVIATAIPISVIATFALMYFSGFTLNIMTLGGLALGVGMLVDNSIVVLENIYRLKEGGMPPRQAAIEGAGEVTAAIIASTLTTVAVFLPMIFVRGMTGVMFTQLAIVVSFALLASLVVAVTIVPMLAAKLLVVQQRDAGARTLGARIYHLSGRFFQALEDSYKDLLAFALNHRLLVLLMVVVAVSVALIPRIGREFMPQTDEGEVRIEGEMDIGTRIELVQGQFDKIEAVVRREVPEVLSVVTSIGGSTWRASGSHTGEIRIALVPLAQRTRSSEEIADALGRRLRGWPGLTIRTRVGQSFFMRRMGGGTESVEVEVRGYDMETADALSRQVRTRIEDVSGVTDIRISREEGSPEELIVIDRNRAADMKLSVSQIATALQTALSGTRAGEFRERGDEFTIRVQLADAEHMDLRDVLDLTLTNAEGQAVVLRNVVSVRPQTGPVRIERLDQERIVRVAANVRGRDLGSVQDDVLARLRTIPAPRDFTLGLGGDFEEQQESFRDLLLSFILAVILVYMVMACQFESLRDPFVVMFTVPEAVIGVALTLFLTRTTFNVQSYIGCIMLAGIVVNNAILLVDHTNLLRRRDGLPLREAIEEAGRRRLRPILMTALTTSLALVPLALGMGEGAEAQAPMARAVIGGLASATLITLVLVPVVYSVFESTLSRSASKGEERTPPGERLEPVAK